MPRRGSSTRPGQTKGTRKGGTKKEASTTDDLVSKFEEQYKEMGENYVAMGKTLSRLKSKLGEERTEREKAIRSELMAEVQKKLMGH
jgi:phage shock protein A